MKLNDNNIQFDKEAHKYYLDGVELQGITGVLKRQLFPDEYKNVDEATLKAAAEYGSLVHEHCELADSFKVGTIAEAQNYLVITAGNGMIHEASEYLVTDGESFASAIDKVYRTGADSFDLADIKTTYKLNKDYVRWQLSVYAYFFELCNPGASVGHLYALWLRSKKEGENIAQRVEVERIPADVVRALLDAEKNGEQFVSPYNMPEDIDTGSLARKMRQLAELQKEVDEMKAALLERMQGAGVTKWEGAGVTLTRKAGAVRKGFDYKKLRKEHAELEDIFANYDTESVTKESILVTIK